MDDNNNDFYTDDNDGNTEYLSFEETMLRMEALKRMFLKSGKVSFVVDDEITDENGENIPSFVFYEDTSFGFVF